MISIQTWLQNINLKNSRRTKAIEGLEILTMTSFLKITLQKVIPKF